MVLFETDTAFVKRARVCFWTGVGLEKRWFFLKQMLLS